ncbi:hypothetical protein FGO68_gene8777 [Halteria grandinella]|uniref:Uncharacterized protein n=1 Tax=Halteria grandinella TaxID=5974 RepID=A0A8J8NBD5_HALGN|nr:hypothetical protein FGO68_gene8777 [Halteria grandinella]
MDLWHHHSQSDQEGIMMENITYGKSWFLANRRFSEPWEESKARTAHEQRQVYAAAISDGNRIVCVVTGLMQGFIVSFLDSLKREFLVYQFNEKAPERLFLSMLTRREFDGETRRVKYGETYYFYPDGRINIESEDFDSGQRTREVTESADVSANWEAYPEFGDYRSLTRPERQVQIEHTPSLHLWALSDFSTECQNERASDQALQVIRFT